MSDMTLAPPGAGLLLSAGRDVVEDSAAGAAVAGAALGEVLDPLGEAFGEALVESLGSVPVLPGRVASGVAPWPIGGVVVPLCVPAPDAGVSWAVCAYARAMVPTSAAAAPIAARGFNIFIADSFHGFWPGAGALA
jgi:hypothetical protein